MNIAQLFEMMEGEGGDKANLPCIGGLFGETEESDKRFLHFTETDITIIAALHSGLPVDVSALPLNARRLYALSGDAANANAILTAGSPGAFYAIVRAWMSELPVITEIVRFGRKALAAADRQAYLRAATDRGDPDVLAVEAAAYKVWHEFDRLRGLLRFAPDAGGMYIARCEPDHFILPAFGPHFRERFGGTPWAIIDDKRRLCLYCVNGQTLEIFDCSESEKLASPADGRWEDLWRLYHKTINNESRNNPGLQKQFMPKRYWKYLTEM